MVPASLPDTTSTVGMGSLPSRHCRIDRILNQTGAMFDRFITTIRRTADTFDQQVSEVRERSISMAIETLTNSRDFAHRAINVREPQELFQLQSELREQAGQHEASRTLQRTEIIEDAAL